MAILYSYPLGVPERTDLIIGTKMASSDTDDLPITQNYSIGSVLDMITTQTGAQTFNQVANVGSGVAGGNTTTNLITFSPIHVKGSFKDSVDSIGTNGQVLSSTGSATKWIDAPSTGVTAVTGTAPIVSSGGNTPVISLANTTVTAGVYTNTDLTVDAQGRITAAASGTLGGVTKIIAGTRISISPTGGTGDVTVTADADTITSLTTTGTSGASTLSSGVLNIPNYAFTDTGITGVTLAVNSTGTWTTPLSESISNRELTLTSNVFAGGTKVGYVPSGGTSSLYLKGDGTWAAIPTGLQFKGTWDASSGGGGTPDLTQTANQGDGFLWITSVAGTAYPNGGSAAPSTWNLGDWAVYVGSAGSGTWTRVPATNAGVTSFKADSTNSTYLTMTPTAASTGVVELDADLSATAVSGNIDSTKFLRGDNKWAVPSYTTDTNTTYSIASGDTAVISLTAASPAGAAGAVTLAASGAASISGSSNTITIGATDTNTTYDYLAIGVVPSYGTLVGGSGYSAANGIATTVAPAGGAGMTVNITVNAGAVNSVSITNPGSGYSSGDVVTITGGGGNATFTLTAASVNTDPSLRLIDSSFTIDDVKLVGGSNVTITRDSDNQVTFVGQNDNTTYTAGTGLTLSGTVFSADVNATQANDDTVTLSATADRFYGVQLDNNTTVADAKLVVNVPWTNTQQDTTWYVRDSADADKTVNNNKYLKFVTATGVLGTALTGAGSTSNPYLMTLTSPNTMGSGFTVEADTNTATTTITQGDPLKLLGGTNVTTVSDPDGTITINSTDEFVGTVTDVDLTHYGDAFVVGITNSTTTPTIAITQKVGATAADYINGIGNIVPFPTIPTGTVKSVACSVSGDAYTATVTDPNVDAVIAIAPQGDATNYINGAGDLADVSQFVPTAGGAMTGDLSVSNEITVTSPNFSNPGKVSIEGVGVPLLQLKNKDQQTASDQLLSSIEFYGSDTSSSNVAGVRASINCNTGFDDPTGTSNRNQGCLEFATYNGTDVSNSPLQRLKITPDGGFSFGSTSTAYGSQNQLLQSNGDAPPTWVNAPSGDNYYVTSASYSGGTLTLERNGGLADVTATGFEQGDVTLAGTQTLTNKTLTTPVIDRISPSAGLLQIDGISSGSIDGGIKLMCSAGSHGQTLKSQPHGSGADNTLLLPDGTGTSTLTSIAMFGNGLTASTTSVTMSGSYTGTFTATGDLVAYSDEKLKSNVKTLDGSKVYNMHGVSFDKDGKKGSGVIAQELEKVAPELIHDEGEYKAVAYGNISGYLIEAIKDLKAEIEELKKQIK